MKTLHFTTKYIMNITISINEQYTLYKGNVTNSNFVGSVILFVINVFVCLYCRSEP